MSREPHEKAGYLNTAPGAPQRRAYEQTWWAQVLVWGQRLGPFVGAFFIAMLAFGFQFRTPSSWFNELKEDLAAQQVQVDELERRITAEEVRAVIARDTINDKLDVLIRFRCYELSDRELATIDIACPTTPRRVP